jgi:hypothetical protein
MNRVKIPLPGNWRTHNSNEVAWEIFDRQRPYESSIKDAYFRAHQSLAGTQKLFRKKYDDGMITYSKYKKDNDILEQIRDALDCIGRYDLGMSFKNAPCEEQSSSSLSSSSLSSSSSPPPKKKKSKVRLYLN